MVRTQSASPVIEDATRLICSRSCRVIKERETREKMKKEKEEVCSSRNRRFVRV